MTEKVETLRVFGWRLLTFRIVAIWRRSLNTWPTSTSGKTWVVAVTRFNRQCWVESDIQCKFDNATIGTISEFSESVALIFSINCWKLAQCEHGLGFCLWCRFQPAYSYCQLPSFLLSRCESSFRLCCVHNIVTSQINMATFYRTTWHKPVQ